MYVQFSLEVAPHPIETKDKNRHLRSRSKKERKITKATDSISFSARPRGRPSFIITLVPKINWKESGKCQFKIFTLCFLRWIASTIPRIALTRFVREWDYFEWPDWNRISFEQKKNYQFFMLKRNLLLPILESLATTVAADRKPNSKVPTHKICFMFVPTLDLHWPRLLFKSSSYKLLEKWDSSRRKLLEFPSNSFKTEFHLRKCRLGQRCFFCSVWSLSQLMEQSEKRNYFFFLWFNFHMTLVWSEVTIQWMVFVCQLAIAVKKAVFR